MPKYTIAVEDNARTDLAEIPWTGRFVGQGGETSFVAGICVTASAAWDDLLHRARFASMLMPGTPRPGGGAAKFGTERWVLTIDVWRERLLDRSFEFDADRRAEVAALLRVDDAELAAMLLAVDAEQADALNVGLWRERLLDRSFTFDRAARAELQTMLAGLTAAVVA